MDDQSSMEDGCTKCRFFSWGPNRLGEAAGHCRKYAPRPHITSFAEMSDDHSAHWPPVWVDDFCGEWEARKHG